VKKLFQRKAPLPEPAGPVGGVIEAEEALSGQLEAIRALDPTVTDWKQVLGKPGAEVFRALVARGVSPEQAYKAVWFDELVTARVEQAVRTALGRGLGKRHLSALPAAAGEGNDIPPEVLRQYRAFFPEWNEAEILADYRKHR